MNADKKDAIIDVPDYSFPVTEINGEAADMIRYAIYKQTRLGLVVSKAFSLVSVSVGLKV